MNIFKILGDIIVDTFKIGMNYEEHKALIKAKLDDILTKGGIAVEDLEEVIQLLTGVKLDYKPDTKATPLSTPVIPIVDDFHHEKV